MLIKLIRYTEKLASITRGILVIEELRVCDTLELPWKDNEQQVSCIPEGEYEFAPHIWTKNKMKTRILLDVPNRDGIILHTGNGLRNTKGCPLLGMISKAGLVNSVEATTKAIRLLPEYGKIIVSWI